jgi:hypothetical protein
MAQVCLALGAHGFNAHHAVTHVAVLCDGFWRCCRVKAGPTASGIKFGIRLKEFVATTDAVVSACGPMVFVFSGEGALGGGFASDFISHGLGVFDG